MRPPIEQPAVLETVERMDAGWAGFQRRVQAVPNERLSDRVGGGGWTRKQMLAHITAWHELTVERLGRFLASGEPSSLAEHEDAINARAARAAEGRTTGEVVQGLEDSYRRLRREVLRLTDTQLTAHDGWAAATIAGNTHGHYLEHIPDLA
jgi:DinB superfamily